VDLVGRYLFLMTPVDTMAGGMRTAAGVLMTSIPGDTAHGRH